ncbi:MAG: hypothetical protein R3E97_02275 [Candidatus Eisenbacteria bacterium]
MLVGVALALASACGEDDSPTKPAGGDNPSGPRDTAIPLGQGMGSSVYALGSHGGQIVAGGGFRYDLVSGDELNGVALWDGTDWQRMGGGLPGGVEALIEFGGALYAGGYFSASDGASLDYMARWNGTVWERDARPNGPVFAFAAEPGRLVAGGDFTQLGRSASRVAIREDGIWRPLGDGFDALVSALTFYRGEIYAGGSFTNSGQREVPYLGRWDAGSGNWERLGGGIDGPIYALAVYRDRLIAGGNFTQAGSSTVANIAQWDGSEWLPMGLGLGDQVLSLTVVGDCLYATGLFRSGEESTSPFIARWDGTSWSSVGAGFDLSIFCSFEHEGSLIVGGSFTQSGNTTVRRIAMIHPTCP